MTYQNLILGISIYLLLWEHLPHWGRWFKRLIAALPGPLQTLYEQWRCPYCVGFWIGLGLVGAEWRWDDDAGLSERPVPWGDGQPRGTGAARAYLRLSLEYDTQLAHADDDAAATRPFICER